MFLAGYYADCATQEKPYNKTWLLIKHCVKLTLLTILFMSILFFPKLSIMFYVNAGNY